MPNIKSAKKRVLTSAKKRENNNVTEQKTKSSIKKTIKDVEAGNKEAATANYNAAIKNIDKQVSSGLMHKNTAARRKSRLTKMLNNMNK